MDSTQLKKRIWLFLILAVALVSNALLRGHLSSNIRVVVDNLLLLIVSIAVLSIIIKEFRRKKPAITKETLDRAIRKIAEKVLRRKWRG